MPRKRTVVCFNAHAQKTYIYTYTKSPLGLVLNLVLENRVESRYGTESFSVPAPRANGVVALVIDAV